MCRFPWSKPLALLLAGLLLFIFTGSVLGHSHEPEESQQPEHVHHRNDQESIIADGSEEHDHDHDEEHHDHHHHHHPDEGFIGTDHLVEDLMYELAGVEAAGPVLNTAQG